MGRQAKVKRQLVQGILAHQFRAHAREVSFRQTLKPLKQKAGNTEIEDRIAQELQAFIVICAEAPVGQCLYQQARVTETVSDTGLQTRQRSVRGHLDRPTYFISR